MEDAIKSVKNGQVAVIPTDTLYGTVARVQDSTAVERIYQLKQRDLTKPLIVLIANHEQLRAFCSDETMLQRTDAYWPGPVSIILPVDNPEAWQHIHRGTQQIAFRIPDDSQLRQFLRDTGPVVAPSANPQGEPPATTVAQARRYFGNEVAAYWDRGERNNPPSTLIKLEVDGVTTLRA